MFNFRQSAHKTATWSGVLLFVTLSILGSRASLAARPVPRSEAAGSPPETAGIPLHFIENVGQFASQVRYQVQTRQGLLRLADDGLWWTFAKKDVTGETMGTLVHLQFAGGDWSRPEPLDAVNATISYLTPDDLFAAVPTWRGVRYRNLYPGLDLELSGMDDELSWRFNGDETWTSLDQPYDLKLSIAGSVGAQFTEEDLLVSTLLGEQRLPLPTAEPRLSLRMTTSGATANTIMLKSRTSHHRPSALQGIQLTYSTFIGGDAEDTGNDIVYASDGYVYTIGEYLSIGTFPQEVGELIPQHDIDSYVAKMKPDGSGFIYLFHIQAGQEDAANGLAVDQAGNAYVAGRSSSPDFPTTPGAYDEDPNGLGDAWVLGLNSSGTGVRFSTMIGKSLREWAWDIALNSAGDIYITGQTESPNFPVTGSAYDNSFNGDMDAFVSVFNNNGSALKYSSFLGTAVEDIGQAIAVDGMGNIYLAGHTQGDSSFPRTIAFGPLGVEDAFVTKLDASGSNAVYSVVMGGASIDRAFGLAVDAGGRAAVSGLTHSGDFPATTGAFDATPNGDIDAFVARIAASGDALDYATYLGGSGPDQARRLTLDNAHNVFVTGSTGSANFPVSTNAYDSSANGGLDVFVTKLNSDGSALAYGTYAGGSADDSGRAVAVSGEYWVYTTGLSWSSDFPVTPNAFDRTHNGEADVVVFSLFFFDPSMLPYNEFLPIMLNGSQ